MDNPNVPKNPAYPVDSVQCYACEGSGCQICDDNGWLTPKNHRYGRRCLNAGCNNPLHPTSVSVYCSDDCAIIDATSERVYDDA